MTFKVRTAAEQVADYYADNFAVVGAATTADLAAEWGTSRSSVYRGLRLADEILNGRGLAKTEPSRASNWCQEVTNDLKDFQASWFESFQTMFGKAQRAAAGEAALGGHPGDIAIFGDVAEAIREGLEKLEALLA